MQNRGMTLSGKMGYPHLASAPILYRSTIQDGGIKNLIYYLGFRSKIAPALQAILLTTKRSFTAVLAPC